MKTFKQNKTAKELGIDTSRKFVVVEGDEFFDNGDIISLIGDDNTEFPYFKNKEGIEHCMFWHELAYADEAPQTPRTLRDMKVGDTIVDKDGDEFEIVDVREKIFACLTMTNPSLFWVVLEQAERGGWHLKEDEPESPKKIKEVTMKEVCEKFGEEVKIIK